MESRGVALIACVPDVRSVRATMHLCSGVPRSGGSLHVVEAVLGEGLGRECPDECSGSGIEEVAGKVR